MIDPPAIESVWRHKRRGTTYRVTAIAQMQTSECPALDDELAVVYQNTTHYAVWVRPLDEFMDGRFEQLAAE